jgi:hypothetical protein
VLGRARRWKRQSRAVVVVLGRARRWKRQSRAVAVGEEEIDLLAALLCVWWPVVSPAAPSLAGGVPEQEPEIHRTRLRFSFMCRDSIAI